jgi:hypothetical protein
MRSWYKKIVADLGDVGRVSEALEYFDEQYREANAEMAALSGKRLIEAETKLPGIVGYRYEQYSELVAIIDYLQIREDAMIGVKRRHYLEHYNRALSDRMVEKFTESDADVIALRELRSYVTVMRNKFEALSKHHEYLHFQLTNITKLRVAGLDEAIL